MSQNNPTLKAMINGILSCQAYERGHSSGEAEVKGVEAGLQHDFAPVFSRIDAMESALADLAECARNGECRPELADKALLLLGDARKTNIYQLDETGLLWAASRALRFMVEPDGEGYRITGQHREAWAESMPLADIQDKVLADLDRLLNEGFITIVHRDEIVPGTNVVLLDRFTVGSGDSFEQAMMRGIVIHELGEITEVPANLLKSGQKAASPKI